MQRQLIILALAGFAAIGAQAQTTSTTTGTAVGSYDNSRPSWLPYTNNGYVGLNVGRPDYSLGCGLGGLRCDDPNSAAHLYMGGMFNPYFGAEIGFLGMGQADRGGGRTRAEGVNLSLRGNVPIANAIGVFGKVGATYGRTHVSALPVSGIATGSESGWGRSYGAGVDFNLGSNWTAVLEWQRHRLHFAGNQRDDVDMTSLGLKYRF